MSGVWLKHASPINNGVTELSELLSSRQPCASEMHANEHTLTDAMAGDSTQFARKHYAEEAWRIVDPVLKAGMPMSEYDPKT